MEDGMMPEGLEHQILSSKRFVNLIPLFLSAELVRRLVQSLAEYLNRRPEKTSLTRTVLDNLGPNFGTYSVPLVTVWIGLVIQRYSQSSVMTSWQNRTLPLMEHGDFNHNNNPLDFARENWITMTALLAFYILIHHFGAHLSKMDKEVFRWRSQHDLGPGMALANFSFLENALTGLVQNASGIWTCPAFEDFIRKETETSSKRSVTPVVLFPNLTGPYYRDSLDTSCIGLASGMVRVEDEARIAKGEREVMFVGDNVSYTYRDKAGDPRTCNFTVIVRKATDPDDRSRDMCHYYFVCDNRPLMAMQKWYNDRREEEKRDVDELGRQVESYKKSLVRLLETNVECRGRYRVLTVDGALSDAVRMVETVSVDLANR